jgi:hypothetical protein
MWEDSFAASDGAYSKVLFIYIVHVAWLNAVLLDLAVDKIKAELIFKLWVSFGACTIKFCDPFGDEVVLVLVNKACHPVLSYALLGYPWSEILHHGFGER